MDTLYHPSGGGKIFANIVGLLMLLVYCYCFNESFVAYSMEYDNTSLDNRPSDNDNDVIV